MLPSNWITDKFVDFEYKTYLLLAYLKTVDQSFSESKLYPYFPELIAHHQNLLHLKNEKAQLSDKFPKELKKIDLGKIRLEYEPRMKEDKMMEEINSIVEYSLPRMERYIEEGTSIYNFVKDKVTFSPVGVIPVYAKEGYIFLLETSKNVNVFQYCFSLFVSELVQSPDLMMNPMENTDQLFCNIQTRYVTTFTLTAGNTLENIKIQLIRTNPGLPNPAAFAVESGISFPLNETLLPVAKKLLVQYIAASSSGGQAGRT